MKRVDSCLGIIVQNALKVDKDIYHLCDKINSSCYCLSTLTCQKAIILVYLSGDFVCYLRFGSLLHRVPTTDARTDNRRAVSK